MPACKEWIWSIRSLRRDVKEQSQSSQLVPEFVRCGGGVS